MKNLAGAEDADKTIREELAIAKVPGVVELPGYLSGEVKTRFIAVFDHGGQRYIAYRAWRYWVVSGRVPMAVAKQLYADPERRKDVRAGGDCGCRPPETWANWHVGEREVLKVKTKAELEALDLPTEEFIFSDTPVDVPGAAQSVDTYHIDSQLGLCRFIELLVGA